MARSAAHLHEFPLAHVCWTRRRCRARCPLPRRSPRSRAGAPAAGATLHIGAKQKLPPLVSPAPQISPLSRWLIYCVPPTLFVLNVFWFLKILVGSLLVAHVPLRGATAPRRPLTPAAGAGNRRCCCCC